VLTLTIGMMVSPEPTVLNLLKRYRSALNYSIEKIIKSKATSISKAHKLLYEELKNLFNLPSRIALDCYREALAVAKSWLRNSVKGRVPRVKTLRMWLSPKTSYRIRDGFVEIIGGYRLRIIGWDKRYDSYENREARLVYKNNKMFLMITKKIPKPETIKPVDIIGVDVNEKKIVLANHVLVKEFETPIEKALHFRILAEKLQRKYSSTRYIAWLRRRGILDRVKSFYRKSRNIVEDWAKKISKDIAETAKSNKFAVAIEDLRNLIDSLRRLPKSHRTSLIMLGYRKLGYWISWQAAKRGVPIIVVDPRKTSSTCPICNSKLVENGYRRLKCLKCGFEADRDLIGALNIRRKALIKMGGLLAAPTAQQMTDVKTNRCWEPMSLQGRRSDVV